MQVVHKVIFIADVRLTFVVGELVGGELVVGELRGGSFVAARGPGGGDLDHMLLAEPPPTAYATVRRAG